ncbi:iron-sulfur cluster assembly accessory protein [Aneurinibacillus sp. BA2021]|nr:iron-sulfur cluster assembly accessory protein [Aneurinibacillus sp. BA2021]
MKCKITRNAAKKIQEIMAQEDPQDKGKMLRVFITHTHGTHAHYGLDLDTPGENDEIVHTDKDIDILLDKTQELLDGVKIDYLYLPEEGFVITNPSKGNHGDH